MVGRGELFKWLAERSSSGRQRALQVSGWQRALLVVGRERF